MRHLTLLAGSMAALTSWGAIIACSSDPDSPPAITPAPDGGPTSDGAPATGTTFTVWLAEAAQPGSGAKPVALEGAIVAATTAGGGPTVEAKTGADGSAKVSADFSKGTAVVTVYAKGYTALSALDLTPEVIARSPQIAGFEHPNELSFVTTRLAPPPGVKVSGTATNAAASDDNLTISSTVAQSFSQAPVGAYQLTVPANTPFSLIGLDWKGPSTAPAPRTIEQTFIKFFRIDRPAITADTTLDIDVGAQAALPTKSAKVKVQIPGGPTGSLGGQSTGYCTVALQGPSTFLGAPTKIAPAVDGASFDGDMTWVEVGTGLPFHYCYVAAPDGTFSNRIIEGYPQGDVSFTDLVSPPVVALQKVRTGDAIEPQGLPPAAKSEDVRLNIGNASAQSTWAIFSDSKKFAIPTLPESIKSQMPKVGLKAQVQFVEFDRARPDAPAKRVAASRSMAVTLD